MKKRLSQQTVDRLAGAPNTVVWDAECPGFGVAIGATRNSYVVQRRVPGAGSKRETIGRCDDLRYEAALAAAQERLRGLAGGRVSQRMTLEQALTDYVRSRKDNIRPRTVANYWYVLRQYTPDWLGIEVAKITPEMVRRRHAKIGETTGRTGTKLTSSANGTMRVMRTVLNHARDRDPTLGANAVAVGLRRSFYRERSRETAVPEERMAEFWAAAAGLESRTISGFIRLALATGMRSAECRSLRWDWVGRDFITVPGEVTKSGRTLRVPITTLVRYILAERRGLVRDVIPFVFPARVVGKFLQEPKKGFDRIAELTGIRVTPHDLRRSYVSAAREAGIHTKHLKMLVSHAVTDITDGYSVVSDAQLAASAQRVADVIAERCGLSGDELGAIVLAAGRG